MVTVQHTTAPGMAAWLVLKALRAYKILISQLFTGSCRFVPSCSDYMAEAVRTHGVTLGVWLGLKRLARCQPLCHAGYDPVPLPRGSDAPGTDVPL